MNLDDKNFPWENLNKGLEEERLAPIEKETKVHWFKRMAPRLVGPAVAIALIVIGRVYSSPRDQGPPPDATVVALLSPLPLAKGLRLDEIPFVPVNLSLRGIAKADRIKIVRPEQIADKKDRLQLKKLVPPNQPLLWSMLEFRSTHSLTSQPRAAQVIYGDSK
jgi:hypothetical protein